MSGSARTRSEQSCNARVLRTNESKCNRPEDSDCLRATRTRGAYPLPGAQETSRDNCGERPRWVDSGPSTTRFWTVLASISDPGRSYVRWPDLQVAGSLAAKTVRSE